MKIEHISIGKFNVAELVKEINKRTAGKNVHGVFFEPTSLLKGVVEIYTTEVKVHVVEVDKPKGAIKSKYIGVHRELPTHRWRASISVNGKRKSLGRFDTEEEAALAYDRVAYMYRGNKAKLNFPDKANNYFTEANLKKIFVDMDKLCMKECK